MRKFRLFILALAMTGLMGCAHSTMRGTVVMKSSKDTAHVCLGDNEVKPGDRLTLFRGSCVSAGGGGKDGGGDVACLRHELGKGTVVSLMNEHYSTVKVDKGVSFDEGTWVEKE